MARNGFKMLLGFEDECITEKHKSLLNFTTNKIGGKPDWVVDGIPQPVCQLCGVSLPLVLQVYAPLEQSAYHRTLYLFACINPNCWNQNESWICIRSQCLELTGDKDGITSPTTVSALSSTDWCTDADEWEDDNNANNNEENGNMIGRIESCRDCYSDDDEDETEEYEEDLRTRLGNLSVDQRNANWGGVTPGAGAQGGAVGRLHSPAATAEIEGDESEVVSIDTPTEPQHDLAALLQEVAPLPLELRSGCHGDSSRHNVMTTIAPLQFSPLFISVGEEGLFNESPTITPLAEHVRELLQEYQQNNEEGVNMLSPQHEKSVAQGQGELTLEKYEKGIPAHGDKMFHQFLSRIQENSGQILRYGREGGSPLLISTVVDLPRCCLHCRGEMVFEMQVLPTLIPKLRLLDTGSDGVHLEFGTVLVYSCRQSCWLGDATWRQEQVVVQAEMM